MKYYTFITESEAQRIAQVAHVEVIESGQYVRNEMPAVPMFSVVVPGESRDYATETVPGVGVVKHVFGGDNGLTYDYIVE